MSEEVVQARCALREPAGMETDVDSGNAMETIVELPSLETKPIQARIQQIEDMDSSGERHPNLYCRCFQRLTA